jgi:hypothetical protein
MIQIFSNLKFAAKTTAITLLACGASTLLIFIELGIFGVDYSDLLTMNPLTSGYLHLGIVHLVSNAIILFLALCSDINRNYNALRIFYVTVLIELVYLPAELAGISEIAIGMSGTCYFLVSRYFLTWKEKPWMGICIVFLIVMTELNEMLSKSSTDNSAHMVHIIGVVFAYFSIHLTGEKLTQIKLTPTHKKV